jgi:hypothetical protein
MERFYWRTEIKKSPPRRIFEEFFFFKFKNSAWLRVKKMLDFPTDTSYFRSKLTKGLLFSPTSFMSVKSPTNILLHNSATVIVLSTGRIVHGTICLERNCKFFSYPEFSYFLRKFALVLKLPLIFSGMRINRKRNGKNSAWLRVKSLSSSVHLKKISGSQTIDLKKRAR